MKLLNTMEVLEKSMNASRFLGGDPSEIRVLARPPEENVVKRVVSANRCAQNRTFYTRSAREARQNARFGATF